MRTYIGHQEAVSTAEFEELAYEIEMPDGFRALFLGERDETRMQRAAREQAAREVLAELIQAGRSDAIEWLNAQYAAQLLCAAALRDWATGDVRASRVQKAA
ncbi:hypothetical protein ACWF94_10230 [Streptomyces sp. NPDC055078]